MLEAIRKRKDNIIITFIIGMVALVMAMYGVGKVSNKGTGGIVAYVNGDFISQREFQDELRRVAYYYQSLLGPQFDPQMLAMQQIPEKTLEMMVQNKLLEQQAQKEGVRVSDPELADQIR